MTKQNKPSQDMISKARELRRSMTPPEHRLWKCLRNRSLSGYRFRRQHPIGPYIADFCCPARKLIIEVDGKTHLYTEEEDAQRTAWLQSRGYQVMRFNNEMILNEADGVAAAILSVLEADDQTGK